MRIVLILTVAIVPIAAQHISFWGNNGMIRVLNAKCKDMGWLSFGLHPEWYYLNRDSVWVNTPEFTGYVTDRQHYPKLGFSINYAIVDYLETRARLDLFGKWYEQVDDQVHRGDPYPVIGIQAIEWGLKGGYPFVFNPEMPSEFSLGLDSYVRFGPGLWDYFRDAFERDSIFTDSFEFVPYVPHDPDFGVRFLTSYRLGPMALHLNYEHLLTGRDKPPSYVPQGYSRPNYSFVRGGVELIGGPVFRLLFEMAHQFHFEGGDYKKDATIITPALRLSTSDFSFTAGIDYDVTKEEGEWNVFAGFSVGGDLVVEKRPPIAKLTGRISDAETDAAVMATISFPGTEIEPIKSNPGNGYYKISIPPGTYRMRVEAKGYRWQEKGLVLKDGDELILDFALHKKVATRLSGKVYDAEDGKPLAATISFPGTKKNPVQTDPATGLYKVVLKAGTYRVKAEAPDYRFKEKIVTLKEGQELILDFDLIKVGKPIAILTGKVTSKEKGEPLEAVISFVGTKLPQIKTDPTTGIYKATIPPGTYSVKVDATGHKSQSLPVVLTQGDTKIVNFELEPAIKVGQRIVLKGIYFDFNSAVIKPSSYPVLDEAAKILKENPTLVVEIGGHTDSVGSDAYNLKLSTMRANAVRNYLITHHNIDPSRLIARGYGESMPIADNRTRAGRELNRRIEFKILRK
ncbi:hypothetical protein DRP53_02555 [candidate division WOR-3 bacterium]|uniref:OmpA-like domain-containing protein n=1 Tax=candidate division WOR-3 bacterium TaxID=2052148 RepID=A0A660SM49_UNCW3|nr:MAG: hypothetical protein DRP53_02555 [candidate division WOR-3 bacterium]